MIANWSNIVGFLYFPSWFSDGVRMLSLGLGTWDTATTSPFHVFCVWCFNGLGCDGLLCVLVFLFFVFFLG